MGVEVGAVCGRGYETPSPTAPLDHTAPHAGVSVSAPCEGDTHFRVVRVVGAYGERCVKGPLGEGVEGNGNGAALPGGESRGRGPAGVCPPLFIHHVVG